jgi:hypothetical protein
MSVQQHPFKQNLGDDDDKLTHDRTPPINPSVYPVTKSFTLFVALSPAVVGAPPVGGLLGNGKPPVLTPDTDTDDDDGPGPSGLLGGMSLSPLLL